MKNWEAGAPIHFFIADYPGLLFTQQLTRNLDALHSMVTPEQQLQILTLRWTEECDLLFGLLQFMSLLAFSSFKYLIRKKILTVRMKE